VTGWDKTSRSNCPWHSTSRWPGQHRTRFSRDARLQSRLFAPPNQKKIRSPQLQPASGVADHLRRSFARFKLCVHFLDLRCLLLELLGELRDGCLQLLNCLLQLRAGTAHYWRLVPKSAGRQTNSNKSNACGRRLFRRVNIADIGVIAFAGHTFNICADIDVPVACRGISPSRQLSAQFETSKPATQTVLNNQ
jgi:hypothetical protein